MMSNAHLGFLRDVVSNLRKWVGAGAEAVQALVNIEHEVMEVDPLQLHHTQKGFNVLNDTYSCIVASRYHYSHVPVSLHKAN